MSSQRSQPFIHPFNFFIVDYGIEVTQQALTQRKFEEAVWNMFWFVGWLERNIVEELEPEVELMERMLTGEIAIEERTFRRLQLKIAQKMHDAGYFLAAKMRPPTRETSMKDIQVTVDKAKYATH